MVTAASIISRVRDRLPPGGSQNFWSDSDLVATLNDSLDTLSKATHFYERHIIVPRRKWCIYTDLRGVLPEEGLRITAIWNPKSYRWLTPTTVRELDAQLGRGWERNIDLASVWFMRSPWWMGVYPKASDDTSPVRVYFSAMHPHVSETGGLAFGLNTALSIPSDFDAAIEEYMLYMLFVDSKDAKRAMEHWGKYRELETDFKKLIKARINHDRTPHMGARR